MTNWRNYTPSTRAAPASLSQGTCYFPGCTTPILVMVGTSPDLNVHIAHIRGAEDDGPRAVPGLSVPQRNAFENLILLCVPHHNVVDKDVETYTIEKLTGWKEARETQGQSVLRGLRGLTEEQLREMIETSFQATVDQLSEAIAKFERVDAEAAALIKSLMGALEESH